MEKDEAWEPTTRIPVLDEDILEVCKQSHAACHQYHVEDLVFTAWSLVCCCPAFTGWLSQDGTTAARQCSDC